MSRRELLIDALHLGPAWSPRLDALQAHPARLAWRMEAPPVAGPVAEPAPTSDTSAPPAREDATHAAPRVPPPAPADSSVASDWPTLREQVTGCTRCRLSQTRTQAVLGRGNPQARWMLIGEAPGEQEDRQGEPFVGRAGLLLDNMLTALGLDRDRDVYIANVIKCRPPGNRNPSGDEIAACQGYLTRQIELVRPDLIIALGRFAAQTLLQSEDSISRLRGRVHRYQNVPMIVTFHPAYLLRNLPDKSKAWQDLLLAKRTAAGS